MKKLLLTSTAVIWMLMASPVSQADDGSTLLGGVLNFAPIVVPGFSTWFPGLNTANITYSNGNKTATCCQSAATYATYGNRGHGTGKWYAEFTITNIGSTCCTTVGLVNLSYVPAANNAPGGQNTGIGLNVSSGNFFFQGSVFGSALPTATTGNVVGLALDIANQNVWIIVCNGTACGNWNNNAGANPATNTGGLSIAAFITAWPAGYPMYLTESGGFAANESVTLNTGSVFSAVVPSGFSAWH